MMMARPGITYQDVATAANELKGQDKNVTIENVRSILGTGSIGTINQHLRKWKETQTATYNLASKENLPDNVIALIKGLWKGMIMESSEQFVPIEANYQQEISDLKGELEKYKGNNQRWQKLFNQWQQEKSVLENEKLTLEQALDFAHKENTSLNTKQNGLHQQLQEKQERIDELHRLHQQTQQNLEHYRESAREQRLLDKEQFEREKQQMLSEIKTLKEQVIAERQEIIVLQQRNASLQETNQFLENNDAQNQNENAQLKVKLREAEKKCHKYLAVCQVYENQNKQLQEAISAQSNQMISQQAENKTLSNHLAEKFDELKNIKDQLKFIAQEKWEIMQEKSILEGQLKQMQKSLVT